MRATTFGLPGTLSISCTVNPQSSRIDARVRAQSPSPGDPGARVGFLESICISARASATASPRGTATLYLFFAVLPAFGFDLAEDFTARFLAAGFIVVFFAVGFLAGAACFAAGFVACLTAGVA